MMFGENVHIVECQSNSLQRQRTLHSKKFPGPLSFHLPTGHRNDFAKETVNIGYMHNTFCYQTETWQKCYVCNGVVQTYMYL